MNNDIRMRATGEILTDYEYRLQHPQTSFMQGFVPEDGDRIVSVPAPIPGDGQHAVYQGIEKVDGEWRDKWAIEELPIIVPEQVPMLNARLALIQEGHMEAVNAILAAAPGVDGEKARAFFEFAQNVRRDHWVVEVLRVALDLTAEQIDQLFILAATLD